MLVESLSQLADAIGAKRVSIEVESKADSEVSIVIVPSFSHTWHSGNDAHGRARAALANPLSLICTAAEADRRIVNAIDQLLDPMADVSKLMSKGKSDSLEDNKAELAKALEQPEQTIDDTNSSESKQPADDQAENAQTGNADSGVGSL
jgi:PRTRC genetic system protein E